MMMKVMVAVKCSGEKYNVVAEMVVVEMIMILVMVK
jgi:hypothetical protein